MKPCLLIPCFDHGSTVGEVIESLARFELPVLVVDDGSGAETRETLKAIAARAPYVRLYRRPRNGGKGAALKTGFAWAAGLGFTHAIQLDADAQHDSASVPLFLEAMQKDVEALVLGDPIFDASAPRARIWARQLSRVSVWIGSLSLDIRDPLCGMRGVPLAAALRVIREAKLGDHMEFEPDFAARALWAGIPIANVRTPVRYTSGGISHFDVGRDFPRLGAVYLRLWMGMISRAPALIARKATR